MSRRKITGSRERGGRHAEILAEALKVIRSGGVVVFPTETFYGLGADALNPAALDRVVSLKGRDPRNPIPLIISDGDMLECVVEELPPIARRLMDRFWPGPLTLVLPARSGLSKFVQNHNGGVGIRISSHPVASALVRELGRPMTATSANPSGQKPARTLAEARAYFSGKVRAFVEGGELPGRRGSTVVEIRPDGIEIIREGEIGSQELQSVLTTAC